MLLTSFGQWRNLFRPYVEKFLRALSKLHSTCPGQEDKKYEFLKNYIFLSFRKLSEKFSTFWQKFFNKVVKTAFYVSIRAFWGKKILKKNLIIFGHWAKTFGLLAKDFRLGFPICNLGVHRNILKRSIFFKKMCIFHQIWTLCKNFSAICQKLFDGVVKTAFCVYRRTFQGYEKFSQNVKKTYQCRSLAWTQLANVGLENSPNWKDDFAFKLEITAQKKEKADDQVSN